MVKKAGLIYLPALFLLLGCSACAVFQRTATGQDTEVAAAENGLLSSDSSLVIAFGSCNHHDDPQTIWDPILQNDPDLWVWLGDNVYGDTDDMTVLATKYRLQNQNESYRRFRKAVPVIGVWDDHDYGRNNAGKEYPHKEESMQLALDFLGEPEDSPRRSQQGIYAAYPYEVAGTKVKVILLDARYNRDPLLRKGNAYVPNPDGDFLGEEQWTWLEEQLSGSDADIHIIGSGIQFIADKHPYEKWANLPASRARLYRLLAKTKAKGVIFISGDRHIAEISKTRIDRLPYPVYDITASGLTHAAEHNTGEENPYRVGPLINRKNFGIIRIAPEENGELSVQLLVKGAGNELYTRTELSY